MPFLALFTERTVLAGLGYNSDINDLDCYTAACLVNIKAEMNKQESEEQKRSTKKGGTRGR